IVLRGRGRDDAVLFNRLDARIVGQCLGRFGREFGGEAAQRVLEDVLELAAMQADEVCGEYVREVVAGTHGPILERDDVLPRDGARLLLDLTLTLTWTGRGGSDRERDDNAEQQRGRREN